MNISGLSARNWHARVDLGAVLSANGHARGSKRRSSRASGTIGMSSMRRVVIRPAARRSSLAHQASMVPSITTTAPPPMDAPVSLPPPSLSVSSITLGRPIS